MTGKISRPGLLIPDDGQGGIILPTELNIAGRSAAAPSASRAYYLRGRAPRDMLIAGLKFLVTTAAGADDNVDVGLLDGQGAVLTKTGAAAVGLNGAGGGWKSIAYPAAQRLYAGQIVYGALCFGAFGGSAVQVWSHTLTNSAGDVWGTSAGRRIAAQQAGVVAIPAAPSLVVAASVQPPVMVLYEA